MISYSYVRIIIRPALALCFLFGLKKTYIYFTHNQEPQIQLQGLDENHAYADSINCTLALKNKTSIKFLDAKLNGKPCDIESKKIIGKSEVEHLFSIDTTLLEDGKHTFALKAVDSTYNKNSRSIKIPFTVDNKILQASFLQDKYNINQGRTARVTFNTNKELSSANIAYLSKQYNCCKVTPYGSMYECFIPIECDQDSEEHQIIATLTDSTGKSITLHNNISVNTVEFPKQKGFKVAQEKIQDEKDVSLSNSILKTALHRWLEKSPTEKLWKGIFDLPCQVTRYSTPFGEIRVTPERGRYLHKAVDIVHTPRSVIWASARGKVIIKDRYLMSGNTVVLEHGMGVHSLYYHLHDFADIEVGDVIGKGVKIGRMGKTGYATGYHLHWEVRINNVAVDPLEWTEKWT